MGLKSNQKVVGWCHDSCAIIATTGISYPPGHYCDSHPAKSLDGLPSPTVCITPSITMKVASKEEVSLSVPTVLCEVLSNRVFPLTLLQPSCSLSCDDPRASLGEGPCSRRPKLQWMALYLCSHWLSCADFSPCCGRCLEACGRKECDLSPSFTDVIRWFFH